MTTPAIEVNQLQKLYECRDGHRIEAVKSVSFTVRRGEIFALLGPNGAGKSTTIEMLATLVVPTSGSAQIAGLDLLRQPEAIRQVIGVTLQHTGLDAAQTVYGLIRFHAQLHGFPREAAGDRAEHLIDALDLREIADRRVQNLSGGMKRRLDLCLALVSEPQVIFLDEPTTGLDPASRRTVWNQIEALRASEVSVLLTTQYLEEADRLADRIAILDEGRIVTEGTSEEMKRRYGKDVVELGFPNVETADRAAQLLGGTAVHDDQNIRVMSRDGAEEAARIVAELQTHGLRVAALNVTKPTLDDVFLGLTGRSRGADGDARAR